MVTLMQITSISLSKVGLSRFFKGVTLCVSVLRPGTVVSNYAQAFAVASFTALILGL